MKIQESIKPRKSLLGRLGASRQVAIPKKLHDELGLSAGDIIEFERKGHQIVLTPKDVIERAIAEGLEDVRKGRMSGPFTSVQAMLKSLHGAKKVRAKNSKTV